MRELANLTLWLYVFTVPWDMVTLPGLGTLSRLSGVAAMGACALTVMAEGRLRHPSVVMLWSLALVASAVLSLLWTISYDATLVRSITYVQLLASVWIVQELVRTKQQSEWLLGAFCLGTFVPLTELVNNYRLGLSHVGQQPDRFTASDLNANDLGLTLVMGIPIAWHLLRSARGFLKVAAVSYFVLAPFAIMLTGTRGAFVSGVVALSIVPLTLLRRPSVESMVRLTAVALALVVVAGWMVPGSSWDRMESIVDEVQGGSMSGRSDIWEAGWRVFPSSPVLGTGAGTYALAIEPLLRAAKVSHNVPLGILVEQGVIGLSILGGLLLACALAISRLAPGERTLWVVLGLAWLVGVMTLNWEYRKVTWLFFGLIAARDLARRAEVMATSRFPSAAMDPYVAHRVAMFAQPSPFRKAPTI